MTEETLISQQIIQAKVISETTRDLIAQSKGLCVLSKQIHADCADICAQTRQQIDISLQVIQRNFERNGLSPEHRCILFEFEDRKEKERLEMEEGS